MGCGHSTPPDTIVVNSTLSCPECMKEYSVHSGTGKEFYEHVMHNHQIIQLQPSGVLCSFCDLSISDGYDFLQHLKTQHDLVEKRDIQSKPQNVGIPEIFAGTSKPKDAAPVVKDEEGATMNLPKIGDRVVSMWGESKWQYFDATILSFDKEKLEYYIEWDDQDPSGRHVSYQNIAVNRPPDPSIIGTGSIVLFHQGKYVGKEAVRLAGVRWHQGKITDIKTRDGVKYYSGVHTKSDEDGKWITYKGYCKEFEHYTIEDLRCGPNIFDLMDDDSNDIDDVDIFFSYTMTDSCEDVLANKAVAHVDSKAYEDMVEPKKIIRELESRGYKVVYSVVDAQGQPDLSTIVGSIKSAKLFISCISNQYCNDEQCRMEIQYAKKSVRKPVIPLMVGGGGYDWQISVVGMLIAGELYIDFRDINQYDEKLKNCLEQVDTHFEEDEPGAIASAQQEQEEVEEKDWSVFISYCWTNSWQAKQKDEIKSCTGGEFSDPRRVQDILARNYSVWLDIERLSSGQDSGMFDQIAKGLYNAKVVIVFVSTEYARSENCKMEFQFACKSLRKPVIPVSVGEGTEWDQTVIGALVASGEETIFDLQSVTSEEELEGVVEEIMKRIDFLMGPVIEPIKVASRLSSAASSCSRSGTTTGEPPAYSEEEPAPPAYDEIIRSRAPYIGAHVVSHHIKEAYYTATIVSFSKQDMTYTVEWDDGDPSGKIQKYNKVALNVDPDEDDIGVGQIVLFPQGRYGASEGNNTGGVRYHEGIVEGSQIKDGVKHFYGHHSKGENDSKWVTYRDYLYDFNDMTVNELRVAPNVMDALQAFESLSSVR